MGAKSIQKHLIRQPKLQKQIFTHALGEHSLHQVVMTSLAIPGLTSTFKVFLWNEQVASGQDSNECWRVRVNTRRKQRFLGDRQDPTRTKDLPERSCVEPGIKLHAMQERGSRP